MSSSIAFQRRLVFCSCGFFKTSFDVNGKDNEIS